MARGYFALRDRERAAREFRAVIAAGPPEGTRATAERYLERLEARAAGASRGFDAYVEATVGRDSNVNAAATAGGLLVPLALASREADGFVGLGAGATLRREIDRTYTVFGGADIRRRRHFDLDEFDFLSADLRLGVQASFSERDRLRLALEHEEFDLDRDGYRRTQGLSAQWLHRLDSQTQISAFAQALRIRYRHEAVASESSDMLFAGAQLARAFGDLVASVSVYAGRDDATTGRADGDRALAGFGGRLQRRLASWLEGHAGVSYVQSDYRSDNPVIGALREDRYVAMELGLDWRLGPRWVLRPQLVRTHNRSNVPLTEYGRTEGSVSLRRLWN